MTMNMPPTNYYHSQSHPEQTLRSLGQYSFGKRNPSINNSINQIPINPSTASFSHPNQTRGISPNIIPQRNYTQ